jgi:uncharacterized protein (DUF58 family)
MTPRERLDLLDPTEVARLGGVEIVAQGVVEGFLSGLHRSPFRGFSVEFIEHRAYQPGDEPRYLDWRILARSDRLFVKQFEEETNLRAMILLDASRSMSWRGAPERLTKREYAQRLAAALGLILLRQRDATGLITFDDAVRDVVPPRVKSGQWRRLLRGIVALPEGRGTAAEPALRQVTSLLVRRGLVVLISDLLLERASRWSRSVTCATVGTRSSSCTSWTRRSAPSPGHPRCDSATRNPMRAWSCGRESWRGPIGMPCSTKSRRGDPRAAVMASAITT